MPIYFTYPIFRTHLLGTKIALIAEVAFNSLEGNFYMEMYFEVNGEQIKIFGETKHTSFNQIADHISTIISRANILLSSQNKEGLIQTIFNKYETNISSLLTELYNKIENYPILKDEFDPESNRILKVINESTANCYNYAHENSSETTNQLNEILNKTKNGSEENIKKIIDISSTAIDKFLSLNKENIDILYNAWKEFYDNSIPEFDVLDELFEDNKHLTFDLGLYYNIKDEMNNVENIFAKFIENLNTSLNAEESNYITFVQKKFNELIDPELLKTEEIAENANNNISVIDAMNIVFTYPTGDTIRNNMINKINNLRGILEEIKKEIFSKISKVYSDKTNQITLNSTLTDINSKLTKISEEQDKILERLRKFNKYDIKFDIYFEDVRVLNDLEINVSREKALSYNKYIINGLKNHSDYFLTDKETKEIKELLLGNFQKIKDYLVKYLFTDAEEEAGKLYDIVKSINEKYLGESLGNRVINFYNNITFIHQIINNYYKDISEAYKKFNTTFVDEYYHKHKDQYVTKPKEIINKILGVSYALNPEKVTLHKEIQELIVNKIRLGITTTSNVVLIDIILQILKM